MGTKETAVRQHIETERVRLEALNNDRLQREQEEFNTELSRLLQEIEKERERVFEIVNQEGVDWSKGVLATFPVPSPKWWNRERFVDKEFALFRIRPLGYASRDSLDIPHSVDLTVRSDGQLVVYCRSVPELCTSLQEWSTHYGGRATSYEGILQGHRAALSVLRCYETPTT